MAGIAKTTKEDILEAAYEIVRKKGIDSLNARALAKELKCSTQPIMYQFSSMEEIKLVFSTKTNLTVENFMLEDRFYEKIEKVISKQTKMSKDEILSFHKKMWLLTHGIASLIADKTCSFTDEEIDMFLTEEFVALMKLEEFKKTDEWKKIISSKGKK